MCLYEFL
jgi:hypothetical protein